MGLIKEGDLDGSIVMQSIADTNSFNSIARAVQLGQVEGFITDPKEGDFNYGYGSDVSADGVSGIFGELAGFGSYLADSYLELGSVKFIRSGVDTMYYAGLDHQKAAIDFFNAAGATTTADALTGIRKYARNFGLVPEPTGSVEGENPTATRDWFIREFANAQPKTKNVLSQLYTAGMLKDGMEKDEVRRMIDTAHEIRGRQDAMAKYTAGWGTAKTLIADLLVMPLDPLIIPFFAARGAGSLALMVGGRLWTGARVAAAGSELAPALRAATIVTKIGTTATDIARSRIAKFLATKTANARLAQVGVTASRGIVPFGSFTAANKILGDIGENHINNHPGLMDEAEAFLHGAGMGVATFGAFSAFAQSTGFVNTSSMKIPALKRYAERGGSRWLEHQLNTFLDTVQVRKIIQEGRTLEEASASVDDIYINVKESRTENRAVLAGFIERAERGVFGTSTHPGNGSKDSVVVALYNEVKKENSSAIAKMKAAYKDAGVELTIVEHPSQRTFDATNAVMAMTRRAKAVATSLEKSEVNKPTLLNVFGNIDALNSIAASNRFTEFLGGGESRMRRAKGNVLGNLIETLFGASELTGRNLNPMKKSFRNATAVRESLNADLIRHKVETRAKFKDSTGREPTTAELDAVTIEAERISLEEGTNFGKGSDYFESPEWAGSTHATPEVKAMAEAHIRHFRKIGQMLEDLGLLPKKAPDIGKMSPDEYIDALMQAGITKSQIKKFGFTTTDTTASMRDRAIRNGYFSEYSGSVYFPRAFSKDLILANGQGYKAAMIKQMEYERANADMNDPEGGGFARQSVLVRAWSDNLTPSGKSTRVEILDLLNRRKYTRVENGVDRPFNSTDLNLTATQLDDALHLSKTGELGKREQFDFSGVIKSYEEAQRKIWIEAADESYGGYASDVAKPTETIRGQAPKSVSTPDNMKHKTFRRGIVSELQEFILKDPETILNRYAATMHGEIGVARALQDGAADLGILYRETDMKPRTPLNVYELDTALAMFEEDFGIVAMASKRTTGNIEAGVVKDFRNHVINRQLHPVRAQLTRLVGQQHYVENMLAEDGMPWLARNVKRGLVVDVGGSMAISNSLDATFSAIENLRPRNIKSFAESMLTMIPWLKSISGASRRTMLETLGMVGDVASLADIRRVSGVSREMRGTTGGKARVTAGVDYATEAGSRAVVRFGGLDHLNRFTRRASTILAWKDLVFRSKALRRAYDNYLLDPEVIAHNLKPLKSSATQAEVAAHNLKVIERERIVGPLLIKHAKAEGLTPYEMGRLSKTGITFHNVVQFTDAMHANGRDWHTNAPTSARSKADFMKENQQVVFDFRDSPAVKGLDYNALTEGLQHEVRHYYNVTPTTLSSSPREDQTQLLRIINHLSSFLSSYSAQRLRPLSQMDFSQSAAQTAGGFISAWMIMAAQRDLSGQMSFEESIRELHENPIASFYSAAGAGGLFGGLHRIAGIADASGVGPSQVIGVKYTGGATGAAQRDRTELRGSGFGFSMMRGLAQAGGPAMRMAINMSEGTLNGLTGTFTDNEKKLIARSMPLQNFLPGRVVNYMFDDPLFWMTDAQRRIMQGGDYPR